MSESFKDYSHEIKMITRLYLGCLPLGANILKIADNDTIFFAKISIFILFHNI